MKKFFLFPLLTVALYGADEMRMRNMESRLSRVEKQQDKISRSAHLAQEGLETESDVTMSGEFLWWTARETGTPLCVKVKRNSAGTADLPQKIVELDWDWQAGVRVALGFDTHHDDWRFLMDYVHFTNKACESVQTDTISTSANREYLLTIWSSNLGDDEAYYAAGKWEMTLNQLDAMLMRPFWMGSYFMFQPKFGLRALRLDTNYHIHYIAKFASNVTTFDDDIRFTQDSKMLGLCVGFDTEWFMNKWFALYMNAGFAELWSDYRMKKNQTFQNVGAGTEDHSNFKDHFFSSQAILDMQFGLKVGFWFWNDKAHLSLFGGWDQHMYINYNQMFLSADDVFSGIVASSNGTLTLSGLRAGLTLDF